MGRSSTLRVGGGHLLGRVVTENFAGLNHQNIFIPISELQKNVLTMDVVALKL